MTHTHAFKKKSPEKHEWNGDGDDFISILIKHQFVNIYTIQHIIYNKRARNFICFYTSFHLIWFQLISKT